MPEILAGNILYGGPMAQHNARKYASLGKFVLEQLKRHGEKVILIDGITEQQYTAAEIYNKVVRLAYALQTLGIVQHDVIGLSGENSIEYAITLFACIAVGATVAPMNITYTERELEHAVQLSKPKIIFATKLIVESFVNISKRTNFIKKIICFDATEANRFRLQSYAALLANKGNGTDTHAVFHTPLAHTKNDVALIICSSGTTGLPKGVQLTQYNLLNALDSPQHPTALISKDELKILSVIPWFHLYGCLRLIMTVCNGQLVVYLPKFEQEIFLSIIEKYRINTTFMVPPLMVFLAKHPLIDKYDLSSLRVLFCGAAPLSREIEDQIKTRTGVTCIRQAYGLSESSFSVLMQTDKHCKAGSVGTIKPGVHLKVIDPETGRTLGANQRGELCAQGDFLMKGYINDSKATEFTIRNGWLHTGDIVYYDEDFEFFIVDRIKELIKYKGYQVPPAEIEALLLTHPKIKDAAVIGKPDEAAGELPMAFVVLQANETLSEQEIVAFVAQHASPAKRIRGGVRFIEEIPKNPSGKILRRLLRDMLRETTTTPKSKL